MYERLLVSTVNNQFDIGGVVGATIGAMAGALLGLKTESGFLRGVKIGAVKGSILSVKIFKFSVALCQNDYYSKEFGCLLPVVRHYLVLFYSCHK